MKIIFDNETLDRKVGWLIEGVWDLYPWLALIVKQQEDILSNQDELDARSARIEAANVVIAQEVADLKAQVAAGTPAEDLDFTRLDAAIAGEEASEPAPVEPAPVETGPAGV